MAANVDQAKAIIKWRTNHSEAAGMIVHEDNCGFFLKSELADSSWMKQVKIVTPKSRKIQQCPGNVGVFAGKLF